MARAGGSKLTDLALDPDPVEVTLLQIFRLAIKFADAECLMGMGDAGE